MKFKLLKLVMKESVEKESVLRRVAAEETLEESKEDLDINSDKIYKKVQVTFEGGDCGHKEKWLFDNMAERELAELDASDSNNLVGDCPKCDSEMYYMTDYKILKENLEDLRWRTLIILKIYIIFLHI